MHQLVLRRFEARRVQPEPEKCRLRQRASPRAHDNRAAPAPRRVAWQGALRNLDDLEIRGIDPKRGVTGKARTWKDADCRGTDHAGAFALLPEGDTRKRGCDGDRNDRGYAEGREGSARSPGYVDACS